jgi:glycosyltransferase involved in cell wall biosynthesis
MSIWSYNPERLRILQISTCDQGGGAEGVASSLWRQYAKMGHQSWLAVGRASSPNLEPGIFPIDHDSYRSRWTRALLRFQKPPDYSAKTMQARLQSLLRLASDPRRVLLRRSGREDFDFPGTQHLLSSLPETPDILHCHNLHGDYFDLRALPALSRLRPLVLTLHDAWLLSGHCAHSFGCERWQSGIGCGHCPNLGTYPAVRHDATAYNWQRKKEIYAASRLYLAPVSKWLLDKVSRSMLQSVKQRVIYNGTQTDLFSPGSRAEARRLLNLPEDALIVLLIAHNEYKDYNTMRAAMEGLNAPGQQPLVFVCLGLSSPDQPLGQGCLRQPGREQNPARMVAYYRAADVFIHAAHEESFGKTITEALACAIPVVATAVGGIPEQVRHGETGFLTPGGDAAAMRDAVSALLRDPALRQRMGSAGREDVVRRFSLEQQTHEFLNWYGEILQDWDRSHVK